MAHSFFVRIATCNELYGLKPQRSSYNRIRAELRWNHHLKVNLRKRRTKSCNLKRTRKRENVPAERYTAKATNKLIRPHSCGLEVESPFEGKSLKTRDKILQYEHSSQPLGQTSRRDRTKRHSDTSPRMVEYLKDTYAPATT